MNLFLPDNNRYFDFFNYFEYLENKNDIKNGNDEEDLKIVKHISYKVRVYYDRIPTIILGGKILPLKTRIVKSTNIQNNINKRLQGTELLVALNKEKRAYGSLYLDDGISFNFKNSGIFSFSVFEFNKNKLLYKVKQDKYDVPKVIEKIVIMGLDNSNIKEIEVKFLNKGNQESTNHCGYGINNLGEKISPNKNNIIRLLNDNFAYSYENSSNEYENYLYSVFIIKSIKLNCLCSWEINLRK